ncbi:four helix bundle protein [Pelagicoccus sp. SDUM812002]|uniref:four helix bundle protein n=1 Tax=Pelagicoccus sp. SDUM812002 TaxID=3041266 RepID=UPI00280CD626|nr:four helix bundle protein [Pelagicoccus sp. SDUM812002]MDQ8186273.1 four helix bundle protein [Pelagicoccus sp. SDUM812002]
MAAYQLFEELPIWQEARSLVQLIYKLTKQDESSKDFGLKDQIQRAGLSVMTNIAGSFDGSSTKGFRQILTDSKESPGEVPSLSLRSP